MLRQSLIDIVPFPVVILTNPFLNRGSFDDGVRWENLGVNGLNYDHSAKRDRDKKR